MNLTKQEIMQWLHRKWKPLMVFPIALILLYIVFVSGGKPNNLINQFIKADNLTETGLDVEILYTEMGKAKAKITTAELTRYINQAGVTEFKKGLKVFFYEPNGNVESNMSANYGKAFEKEEELIARDNVIIINTKGEQLNTEELIWKRKDQKIYSTKFVKITTAEEIIMGEGLEAKEDFSDYVIKKVTGTIKVNAKPF